MLHEEYNEQVTVIQHCAYIKLLDGKVGDYIYAIENEGRKSPQAGKRAKKMGKKAGVSDLHLPVPIGNYCGLWIEMKKVDKKAKASPAQKEWIQKMLKVGHYACVCHGHKEAIEIIKLYIAGDL